MNKRDFISSVTLGFLIGVLVQFILSRLERSIPLGNYLFLIFPVLAPIGLYVTSILAGWLPVFFQLGKFVIVGTANFSVDIAVFHAVIMMSGSARAANLFVVFGIAVTTWTIYKAISFVAAVSHSFFWNKFWTFGEKDIAKTKVEYMQFVAVSLVSLLINGAAFSVVFALRPEGAQEALWGTIGAAFGAIAGLAWNFIGYKFFVFRK